MPELPEIETIARGLRRRLPGAQIAAVELLRRSIYRGPSPAALVGATVTGIARAGKYLVIELTAPDRVRWQLMVHLGMTGQLVLCPPGAPRAPHTHLVVCFAGISQLHFRDPRRFGRVALAPAPVSGFAPALGIAPGHEPLQIGEDDFLVLFRHRAAPVKNALMNQRLLRGVGNIYADESLFRAAIHPRARRLSRPRLLRLRLALREVLEAAIAAGGSSISDYVNSSGKPGRFHLQHAVYDRAGLPCPRCATPIRRIVLAGRSAHFCPHCQRP
ncbi:MAG: bifunctional DNA-formamidopyrimidine glycosylase/DNA-(apurinic or apyrimidinic site) lyase [Terriglobales bacterium]